MKNLIDTINLNDIDYNILNRYLGQGKLNAPFVFFGNEPGLSGSSIEETVEYLKISEDHVKIQSSRAFLLSESYSHPTASDFARFIARFMLAVEYKDERFFGQLSPRGIAAINNHILSSMKDKKYTLINLRPLPRPTEDIWVYSNIDKKDYNRKYNFCLKRDYSDKFKEDRIDYLRDFFIQSPQTIVIGVGDKENKKRFFEKIYKQIKFKKSYIGIIPIEIYYSLEYKIILCNYFNSRNGIKLQGLHDLYKFIIPFFDIKI